MLRNGKKLLLGLGVSAAVTMAASPANAWYAYVYNYADGSYAGTFAYCDSGMPLFNDGVVTPYGYYDDHNGELPC